MDTGILFLQGGRMKKLLFGMALMTSIMVMPVTAQANDECKTVESAQEEFEPINISNSDVTKKYALYEMAIYREPDEASCVLGYTMVNTSFDVAEEAEGWSTIITFDGNAYIKSEALSVEPRTYTDEELYILAHVLAGECQSCPDQEQLYVGSVVLNRVAHPSFPDTIEEVVFQKGQYACTRDGNYYREPTDRNWANAKTLLENGSILPANVIWQSGGRQGKGVYIKTKWHYYCY